MQESDIVILHEDDSVVVIDKPSGLITHPKYEDDDQYSVAEFMKTRSTDKTPLREGIVHRLDKDTSGMMICAKSSEVKDFLQNQFKEHKVSKTYSAVVYGKPEHQKLNIDLPIDRNPKRPSLQKVSANGKEAFTSVEVIESNNHLSYLEVKPKSGRTHQIRVHLKYIGNPVVNDPFYASTWEEYGSGRLMLHAKSLNITLPGENEPREFASDEPAEFKELVK